MSVRTHIHTHIHTHTYRHDNYYNPRCAHAHRGLMNKRSKDAAAKKELIEGSREN